MNFARLLTIAGVPPELHDDALSCLALADARSEGLLRHKLKVRLFKAGKIADALDWGRHRLIDARPELSRWDIAPMINITANGDNGPWVKTPDGGRPIEDYWLNPDPESDEYREAVSRCYWAPGRHPRSTKARRAWYRRNGGEYEAWARGVPVDLYLPVQEWSGEQGRTRVSVVRCGDAWVVNSWRRYGPVTLKGRHGFEIDNIMQDIGGRRVQAWYPLPGYQLRAPVTWSTIPRRS